MNRYASVGGILALTWGSLTFAQSADSTAFLLEGNSLGILKDVTGGAISANVINEVLNRGTFIKKHLGPVQYEPFEVAFGMSMLPAFYDLPLDLLKGGNTLYDGELNTLDANLRVRLEREFKGAQVTEIGFPALDASSKEAAYMTMKLKPSKIESTVVSKPLPGSETSKKPQWISSNFRLDIDGLDTRRVSRIDAFTVKRSSLKKLEVSNLKITLAEVSAKTWQQWLEEFVVRGVNNDGQEKAVILTFLAPDMKTELGRVNLGQCGIFRLAEARSAAGAVLPSSLSAELYCEQLSLDIKR